MDPDHVGPHPDQHPAKPVGAELNKDVVVKLKK